MQVGDSIYVDYQASTPMDPRVTKAMMDASQTLFANPHSADHALGWNAARQIEQSSDEIAKLFGIQSDEVLFTSGASEANALIFSQFALAERDGGRSIIVGAADHKSAVNEAEKCGLPVRLVGLNQSGSPDPDKLEEALKAPTALVSLVGVNNENGAITDIEAIAAICKAASVPLHLDLAQSPLTLDINLADLDISFATISGHKIYGPKGIGALLIAPGLSQTIRPIIRGAGQQGGLRGGTLPTELIIGFGKAAQLLRNDGAKEREQVAEIRNHFVDRLESMGVATLVGGRMKRHPGNALMRFSGLEAAEILARLQPNVAASTQSACSSGSMEPSHVLNAMGLSKDQARECIRFSFGRFSTIAQADQAIAHLVSVTSTLLQIDMGHSPSKLV